MESMSETSSMDVAVVGVGRMGRYHARAYKKLENARLVAVVDTNLARAQEVASEFQTQAFANVEDLLRQFPNVKAASVAVPTRYHLPAATALFDRNIGCLVEKPLAGTSAEAREIAARAQKAGVVLQVGHTERFNPAFKAVSAMGLSPKFMEVVRVSPMTFRSLDVGVVMDMMIHDLDIVLTLAQSPIAKVEASGVAVIGKHEDIANARITFESGCVANVTASRLALRVERKLRLFSPSAYVSLDYQNRTGIVISRNANAQVLDDLLSRVARGDDLSQLEYLKLVKVQPLDMGQDADHPASAQDPLTAELQSFIQAVQTNGRPQVDAAAGVAAVDAAERVVAAIKTAGFSIESAGE